MEFARRRSSVPRRLELLAASVGGFALGLGFGLPEVTFVSIVVGGPVSLDLLLDFTKYIDALDSTVDLVLEAELTTNNVPEQ